MKGPVEIDGKNGPPGIERVVPGFHVGAGDSGIVHQDVYAFECPDRFVARAFNVRIIGDIDCKWRDVAAVLKRGGRLPGQIDVTIPDRNRRTGVQKPLHDRASDALRTAGNNRIASTEIDLVGHCRLQRKN